MDAGVIYLITVIIRFGYCNRTFLGHKETLLRQAEKPFVLIIL